MQPAEFDDTDFRDLTPMEHLKRQRDETPMVYICATMWHETENEMVQVLKSIFRYVYFQMIFGLRSTLLLHSKKFKFEIWSLSWQIVFVQCCKCLSSLYQSSFRLDIDQCARRNAQMFMDVVDPDYYEFEGENLITIFSGTNCECL